MRDFARQHPQSFCMISALLMLLVALIILSFLGKDYNEGPVVIALGGAIGTIVGAIAGKAATGSQTPPKAPADTAPPSGETK